QRVDFGRGHQQAGLANPATDTARLVPPPKPTTPRPPVESPIVARSPPSVVFCSPGCSAEPWSPSPYCRQCRKRQLHRCTARSAPTTKRQGLYWLPEQRKLLV